MVYLYHGYDALFYSNGMMHDQNFWKGVVKEGAVLNPVDRISEVLFGLIMVLTFTGAISVATDGRQEIRELLMGSAGMQCGLGPGGCHHVSDECAPRTWA